jgi:hypothetical protein
MKVAILSESEADEAVIRALIEGILGKSTEVVPHIQLRSRGWPAVRDVLPAVLRHLQYQTDAEALVVVADSNNSPVHQADHAPEDTDTRCRFCELRRSAQRTLQCLRPVGTRQLIHVAIGLAVPSLEAWLLCGRDPGVTENAWIGGLQNKREPYTKNGLKHRVYGTDIPNIEILKRRGIEEARRLVNDLATLESRFPAGFGSFADQIRAWLNP